MLKKQKNIIAYVMSLPENAQQSVRTYEKMMGKKYRIMLIRDSRYPVPEHMQGYDILLSCDLSKSAKIAEALLPYQDELLAITCRAEASIARFMKIIPHVPYLRTPSTESLGWATDKYEMRKRLRLFDKKNTPVFTWVKENSKKERKRVIEKVGFPMIVKPANLAASLFVSICYHEDELEKVLLMSFKKIKKAYENDQRLEEPKIIAEEYMEGDMYSIDSYVNSRGDVYHCPMVRVKTGRDIGHNDFYNYLQMTPTGLKKVSIEKAQHVAETAIHALGLRSTTAHVELMKVDDEWKIIEVGPRMGGFRDTLHMLSCDIDHSLNDIFIRIPKKPVIPKKCKGYSALMKYFADKEGVILETKGIKKIEDLESFHSIAVKKKVGERSVFARNGGRSIFNAVLYNKERSKLLADIRRIEQMVKVTVGNGKKPTPVKKIVKKKK
ncbi:MAG: putative ATP-grasp superfamily ATP-dependent carboligase [Candidatus Azotimanducaceae bacterium]|jgi:predicted ATP-grasp superfamily ATP-dependent carboligase